MKQTATTVCAVLALFACVAFIPETTRYDDMVVIQSTT